MSDLRELAYRLDPMLWVATNSRHANGVAGNVLARIARRLDLAVRARSARPRRRPGRFRTPWCLKPRLLSVIASPTQRQSAAGYPQARGALAGLYGSPRASALAAVDRRYYYALIVAGLSNDASYAERLVDTFGRRIIGVQITRNGDGMNVERRPVNGNSMLIYMMDAPI